MKKFGPENRGAPAWFWNGLFKEGYEDGCDYFYQLNDDIDLMTGGTCGCLSVCLCFLSSFSCGNVMLLRLSVCLYIHLHVGWTVRFVDVLKDNKRRSNRYGRPQDVDQNQ